MLFEVEDMNWFQPLTSANSGRLKWLHCKEENNDNKISLCSIDAPVVPSFVITENNDDNNNNNNNLSDYNSSSNYAYNKYYNNTYKNINNPLIDNYFTSKEPKLPLMIIDKSPSKMITVTSTNNRKLNDESIDFDLYNVYRQKVIKALQKHKFFSIYCGQFPSIRQSLLDRGWIEKIVQPTKEIQQIQNLSLTQILKNTYKDDIYEMVLLSKIAVRYNTNFIWQGKINPNNITDIMPYRNRIRRLKMLNFTTKEGLIGCIEKSHWYIIDGISEIKVPRFHNLTNNDELLEFEEDYRTTYCLSLFNYINNINNINLLFDVNGQIPVEIFNFACNHINNEIKYRKHINLDTDNELFDNNIDNEEWFSFYDKVNRLINGIEKFRTTFEFLSERCLIQCKILLKEAYEYWPTLTSDGYNNLWILKPAALCRGRGIIIKQNYNDIQYVLKNTAMRYIVQKYIERPLIIHKTKFDIRQFMLLTITESKLSIWMYKDCYLRFSSQEYELSNLNESIHLTNHAIQKKYKIGERSDKIPDHNMWNLLQFKEYLKECNKEHVWHEKIYNGMRKNIIAIVLSSLEEIEFVPNTFELYGCDFMLDENYEPILLEINSSPDLNHTTPVTSQICPAALEDLIKVVIDLPKHPNCDTGNFQLIYSINCEKPDKKNIQSVIKFEVSGKRMKIHRGEPISYNEILKKRIKQIKENKQKSTDKNLAKITKKKIKKHQINEPKEHKKLFSDKKIKKKSS